MALCVRRLGGAPGLVGVWKSGVRGAGGAVRKLKEGSRVCDVILFWELSPYPKISSPARLPVPQTAFVLLQSTKPVAIRLSSPTSGQDTALRQLKDNIIQNKLPPEPVFQFLNNANSSDGYLFGRESSYLSSAQLDCFRSLFEPGVCRTPYQALAYSTPAAHESLLEFTLTDKNAGSPATGSKQPSMEEHLAVMLEKLREELPKFLWKPANVSLYRQDMEFISSIFHMHFRGLVKYQLFLTFMRLLMLSYYSNSRITVLKLTSHPETNSIHARWSFTGLPLHLLFFYFFKSDKNKLYSTFDAFSTFQLSPDGLICLHKVERMMPSPPLTVTKTILAAALVALGLAQDRPALNLLSTPKLPHEL